MKLYRANFQFPGKWVVVEYQHRGGQVWIESRVKNEVLDALREHQKDVERAIDYLEAMT